MNETQQSLFRRMIINLFDDNHGINSEGYTAIKEFKAAFDPGSCNDIFLLVETSGGRFFLPENHGLVG
jgi:hypothetical protein